MAKFLVGTTLAWTASAAAIEKDMNHLSYLAETIPKDLHGFLNPNDPVAISFWIVSMAMIASTAFFMLESMSISHKWKTSMNVGSLVTLIAGVHYFYMREYWVTIHMSPIVYRYIDWFLTVPLQMIEYWVTIHMSPIVYRYIDWFLTVPLQMIEFYLILSAVKPNLNSGMFYRLLFGTVMMLLFGYLGEALIINPWLGFIVGMCGWGFILYEIFAGEGAEVASNAAEVSDAVRSAFGTMRFIVSVGWSIYPLGYFFGYLTGVVSDSPLNLIYNVADFVNKIWFCLAIWGAAKAETRLGVADASLQDPLLK